MLFWGLVACVMLLAFWAAGGHATVPWHKLPLEPTAQALLIENVVSRVETGGARDVLFVDGDARNRGSTARPLPAIAVAVTDNEGMTTRYLIGPHVPELRPGGSVAFSSRLEAPRSGVRTVSVAFEE